jgi:L-lactate utilization protein LutB
MTDPIAAYWSHKLAEVQSALAENAFGAHVVPTAADAARLVLEELLPQSGARRLAWGGSKTFVDSGLYAALRERKDLELLDPYLKELTEEAKQELRRQALLADLFITGTNALLETGVLVNLDMLGNRVAALTFGPRRVVVLAGRNKIVPDLEAAEARIKGYAAPVNAFRLSKRTPCVKTFSCHDCRSPDRICNTWTITEKSYPKGRIQVVLIDQELGF